MLFLKQLVKPLVLSSADLLHRTSHTKTFLLRAIFYLSNQCLPKVSSLHCIVPMPMSLSPVTLISLRITAKFSCNQTRRSKLPEHLTWMRHSYKSSRRHWQRNYAMALFALASYLLCSQFYLQGNQKAAFSSALTIEHWITSQSRTAILCLLFKTLFINFLTLNSTLS